MDFTQLTQKELLDFLQLNGKPIPWPLSLIADAAQKLFRHLQVNSAHISKYTIPVLNLYRASLINKLEMTMKYDYNKLLEDNLQNLSPLFDYFKFSLTEENRERIINILRYAHLIDYSNSPLSKFEGLPDEILHRILSTMSDEQVNKLCRGSSRMEKICSSDYFWHNRYNLYFGESVRDKFKGLPWKDIYSLTKQGREIPIRVLDANFKVIDTLTRYLRIYSDDKIIDLVKNIQNLYDETIDTWLFFGDDYSDLLTVSIRDGKYTKTYKEKVQVPLTDTDTVGFYNIKRSTVTFIE